MKASREQNSRNIPTVPVLYGSLELGSKTWESGVGSVLRKEDRCINTGPQNSVEAGLGEEVRLLHSTGVLTTVSHAARASFSPA